MNEQNKEDAVNILKQLTSLVSKLIGSTDARIDKPEAVLTPPKLVTPAPDGTKTLDNIGARTLAINTPMMTNFVELARSGYGMLREDARSLWREVHGKTKRVYSRTSKEEIERATTAVHVEGKAPEAAVPPITVNQVGHTVEATMSGDARKILAAQAVEHALKELHEGTFAVPVVPDVKPLEPQPVKAPEAAMLAPPANKAEITGTLISAVVPPIEVAPKLTDTLTGPVSELAAVGKAAHELAVGKDDIIGAVKHIREKTGFGLLEAKMWVDSMKIPGTNGLQYPIILKTAMDEFIRRRMTETKPTLGAQVMAMRKATTDKAMAPGVGKAEGQKKIDLAGDKKSGLVQIARRVARELAVNGPITIDDVTRVMSATHNVLPITGKQVNQWKGSVFSNTEWRYIGDMPSQQVSSHARPVGLWALKSWLAKNTLNGKDTQVSSYVLSRLYKDFEKKYPTADLSKCSCIIGEECLAPEIKKTIETSDNKLYRVPVKFVPGSIGAMISLPAVPVALATPQSFTASFFTSALDGVVNQSLTPAHATA